MRDWHNILVARSGSLGTITLNRPLARNPLDDLTATELLAALEQHFTDDRVRSIVITGAGDAFCAGGDLRQMNSFSSMSAVQAYGWPAAIVAAHKRMLSAEKPVIAAVNGPAAAGGMGLAGMCDVVLAVESATFALPEVKIGLFPMIIVAHLARSLPRKRLLEMMLTGDAIDAKEAWQLGFVNRLAANAGELSTLVADYARRFEAVSPTAVALGRRAFTLLSDMPASQALDAAQFFNLPFFLGGDLREGANAFLEKRPAQWEPFKPDKK
jgi:enoyl-CoA hydratase/carnithine racemase